MNIEYLEKFKKLERGSEGRIFSSRYRREMCREYSFAIPSPRALRVLAELSPLVELGAGSGYWAMLIRQAGGKIIAYERDLGSSNKYAFTRAYGTVLEGDEKTLQITDDRLSLLLCWPNYNTDFAYNCLRMFKGNRIAYIGEPEGGCTGNLHFFELLRREWFLLNTISIPQWPGIHDSLFVYERLDAKRRREGIPNSDRAGNTTLSKHRRLT
jgi:hypothetical protein